MEKENKEKSPCLNLLIFSLCALVILAHFVSSFFPSARLWGISHLAYFPLEFGILFTSVFLLLLIPSINSKILDLLKVPLDRLNGLTFDKSKRLWFILLSFVSFPLFWVFRTRTHFLGDGYHIIQDLHKGEFFVKWTELIETLIYVNLYKLLNPVLGVDAETLYELVSCFYGAIFVFLIFLLADFLGEDKWEKLFLFCLIAFMGSILLFCGYAEHYSFSYVLIFAYIFLSMKYLKERSNPFLPLAFLVLAVFSHISVSYLLPSAFLLCFLGYDKNGKSSFLEKKETWAILFLIVTCIIILLYVKEYSWMVGNKYVPLTKGDYYAPGYSLFSLPHILDILNEQFLVSPVGFVLLISIWICLKSFNLREKTSAFLSLAFLLGIGFNSLMYPGLGMARDWDMFASTAIGYTILAGYLFLRYAKKRVDFKYIGSILIITTAFCTLPWILLNTSEQKGVERFKNLLDLDPKKSRNGHFTLAAYFDKKGLYEEVEKENQVQASNFPELVLVNQGIEAFYENQTSKALRLCEEALAMEPNFAEAYFLLGKIHQARKSNNLAKKEYKKAIELYPIYADAYVNLGHLYAFSQELDSAFHYYKRATALHTRDRNVYNNLANIYSNKGKWKQATSNFQKAIDIDPDFAEPYYGLGIVFFEQNRVDQAISRFEKASELKPGFALAHYHLAYLYAQKGERDKAERELEVFSQLTSDKKEVEKLKELIESFLNK
ncbi:MAG: tetratricopeptide repeat protein [Candidatus Zixiibacteriota bacterium]